MSWWKKLFGLRQTEDQKDHSPNPAPTQGPAGIAPLVAFHPHNVIEHRLVEASSNPDLRMAFQRELLGELLYAATPELPLGEGERTTQDEETLSLLNVSGPEGSPVVAVFTAKERLVEVFGTGVGFVAMRGEELLSVLTSHGAWLNPGFPYSVYWTPEQLSVILSKPVKHIVQKGTPIHLGIPSDHPSDLIRRLQGALSSDNRIREAWFALAEWPNEGRYTWYLDVRTVLDPQQVNGMLSDTIKKADFAGLALDITVSNNDATEGEGIRLVPVQIH
jgi:SseB protein N-terminal domain/SseB protein C-terminal domain